MNAHASIETHANAADFAELATDPAADRAEAEAAIAGLGLPPHPPEPADRSVPALVAHYHAAWDWLEDEIDLDVFGDEGSDVGSDYLSLIEQEVWAAPCLDLSDARAKLELMSHVAKAGMDVPVAVVAQQIAEMLGGPGDAAAEWDRVFTRYRSAHAANKALTAEIDRAWEAVNAACPMPPELQDGNGGKLIDSEIDALKALTLAEKDARKATLRAYEAAWEAAAVRLGYRSACDQAEASDNEHDEAWSALWATPAPNPSAVFQKLSVLWEEDELDNPDVVAELLTRKQDQYLLRKLNVFRDAAQMAGVDLATKSVAAWDVETVGRQFLADYEGYLGDNGSPAWPTRSEEAQAKYGSDLDRLGPDFRLWRSLTDWQRRALAGWLKEQPCKAKVNDLERAIRRDFHPGYDPRIDNRFDRRNSATIAAVYDRIPDLIGRHETYKAAEAWVSAYLAAGGGFHLTPNGNEPGFVFLGATPESAAGKMDLPADLRLDVIEQVHGIMKALGTGYVSAETLQAKRDAQ